MRLTLCSGHQKSKGFSLLEIIVAVSILGMAVVALFQLFSIGLRSTKKADDYSRALLYARSIMDEAYTDPEISEKTEVFNMENYFRCTKDTRLHSADEKASVFKITVTVAWPPSGSLELAGLRIKSESEKE